MDFESVQKGKSWQYIPGFGWDVDTNDIAVEERTLKTDNEARFEFKKPLTHAEFIEEKRIRMIK